MKLIIPVAGSSTRYQGTRPKWLLTMPNGQLMIEKSLSGLDLENIEEIIIIMLREHTKYIKPKVLIGILKKISNIPTNIFLLDETTVSQPSTISKYLKSSSLDFDFFIKDSDNYFEFKPKSGNSVSFVDLGNIDLVDAGSKSYIAKNNFDEIEQIVEKKVISDIFCCGGYGFKSSKEFLATYEGLGGDGNKDLYISHLIQKKLLDGSTFHAYEAFSYESYGTLVEFRNCVKEVKTIFCDFDGILVENSSKFSSPPWQYVPIEPNLYYLEEFLSESKDSKLIITTSRPQKEELNIKSFLKEYKIDCHSIICSLPHAKRVLVNDFSKSNPYPSSVAINLPRDSDELSNYF
tara:strand:- start:313 stop:1356 length:1044 start_codon:yes stop_codon:yes gene_type:complete